MLVFRKTEITPIFLHEFNLPSQFLRQPQVVGIKERDIFARRNLNRPVPRDRSTAVPLVAHHLYARVSRRVFQRDFITAVRGAVVHDEHLPVCVRLREHRLDRLHDEAGAIVVGRDDGDKRGHKNTFEPKVEKTVSMDYESARFPPAQWMCRVLFMK